VLRPCPFAIVTGASRGIGMALACECLDHGDLRSRGSGRVDVLQADLAGAEGVDRLCAAVGGRRVDALLANAGRGLGGALFLDQAAAAEMHRRMAEPRH
jgi:short-subunit dehydrogenase